MSKQDEAKESLETAYQYALTLAAHPDLPVRESSVRLMENLNRAKWQLDDAINALSESKV